MDDRPLRWALILRRLWAASARRAVFRTHTDTHTAAVVVAATGALVETVTVPADPAGYQSLLAVAERHGGLRAFAVEGAGGYGAGQARHLAAAGEVVVELDRPARPARRGGRRSDPLDAERAARDALARTRLAAPKTGPQRGALQALLTARRSAVEAATDAQRQLGASRERHRDLNDHVEPPHLAPGATVTYDALGVTPLLQIPQALLHQPSSRDLGSIKPIRSVGINHLGSPLPRSDGANSLPDGKRAVG